MKKELTIGAKVPDFELETDSGEIFKLSDAKGKNIVLYFYPKDNTPGCTIEANDFKNLYPEFKKANTIVVGVSRDSVTSHQKFKEKCDLPFILLSDAEGELCKLFDVWVEKSMMGKKYMGIERSTFIIDPNNILREIWRDVTVADHAKEVLYKIKEI